jgi:formate dehydrogenase
MPNHAMTPHYSGTTLDAELRYAAGTKEILRRFFDGEPLNPTDVIVQVRTSFVSEGLWVPGP